MDLTELDVPAGPKEVRKYMKSLFHALNAIVELSGPPIQERRLLLEFPARAETAQKTAMVTTAFGLIGANNVDAEKVKGWVSDWKSAFKLASADSTGKKKVDVRINLTRLNYYEKAVKAMLEGEIPLAALWPLFHTWTLSAEVLEGDHLKFWQNAAGELGLLGEGFTEHVEGLDHFIDDIEVALNDIAIANGLETTTGI
jgi:hypothetical protein